MRCPTGDLSTVSRDSANALSFQFEAPLKEFTRMMKSVRAVMVDRTNALSMLQQAKADLDAKRVKMNKLRGTPGIKEEKVQKRFGQSFWSSSYGWHTPKLDEHYPCTCKAMVI